MKLNKADVELMALNMVINASTLTQSLIKDEQITEDQAKDIAINALTNAITLVLAIENNNENGIDIFRNLSARTINAARETLGMCAENENNIDPDQKNIH